MIIAILWLISAGVTAAARREVIPITSYSSESDYDGNYRYSYTTGNGISVSEEGHPEMAAGEGRVAEGSYSYTAPDGRLIEVRWYADKDGFFPSGDHIPAGVPRPAYPSAPIYYPAPSPPPAPRPPPPPIQYLPPLIPAAGYFRG